MTVNPPPTSVNTLYREVRDLTAMVEEKNKLIANLEGTIRVLREKLWHFYRKHPKTGELLDIMIEDFNKEKGE